MIRVFTDEFGLILSAVVFLLWWSAAVSWWMAYRPSSSPWILTTLGFNLAMVGMVLIFMAIRIAGGSHATAMISIVTVPIAAWFVWLFRQRWKVAERHVPSQNDRKTAMAFVALVAVYFIIVSPLLFANGFDGQGNLRLYGEFKTEVLQHISMSQSLNHFPVPHSLQSFSNTLGFYHFFPNVFLHILLETSGGTHPVPVYNFFTAILLFGLALNSFAAAFTLWNRRSVAWIAAALSLFCYDISSLVLWIRGLLRDHTWFFGTFQPELLSAWTPILTQFQLFTNPSYLFSSVLLLGCIVMTHEWKRSGGRLLILLTALSWAFLFKAKITAFLMGVGGLLLWSIAGMMRRDYNGFKLFGLTMLFAAPVFWMSLGHAKNTAEFSNWYFPANFALRSHFLDAKAHEVIVSRGFVPDAGSMLKLGLAAVIYYVGLGGWRWIIFFRKGILPSLVRHFRQQSVHALAASITAAGVAAFVLISNGVARYDSMWFYLTAIFILNVFAAERLRFLTLKPQNWKTLPFHVAAGILVFFSTLTFLIPAVSGRWLDPVVISRPTVEALEFLRQVDGDPRIATHYYHMDPLLEDDESSLITAFTGKRVVCEGIRQDHHFRSGDPDFRNRVVQTRADMDSLFLIGDRRVATRIIERYQIDMIYLQNSDTLSTLQPMFFPVLFQNADITILSTATLEQP